MPTPHPSWCQVDRQGMGQHVGWRVYSWAFLSRDGNMKFELRKHSGTETVVRCCYFPSFLNPYLINYTLVGRSPHITTNPTCQNYQKAIPGAPRALPQVVQLKGKVAALRSESGNHFESLKGVALKGDTIRWFQGQKRAPSYLANKEPTKRYLKCQIRFQIVSINMTFRYFQNIDNFQLLHQSKNLAQDPHVKSALSKLLAAEGCLPLRCRWAAITSG